MSMRKTLRYRGYWVTIEYDGTPAYPWSAWIKRSRWHLLGDCAACGTTAAVALNRATERIDALLDTDVVPKGER